MAVCAALIGAGFGLERRLLDFNAEPQADHHFIQHMIMLVTCPVRRYLQRHVEITQVLAYPCQTVWIITVHSGYSLSGCCDPDYQALGALQQVATAQYLAPWQEQACFPTIVQRDFQATFDALLNGQA